MKLILKVKILYIYIVCVGFFHLYTGVTGSFEAYLQRTTHLMLILPLTYLLFPMTKDIHLWIKFLGIIGF